MDLPGNNCTPIRRGMDFAINDASQLDYGSFTPGEKRDRIVLLLSDGFHNQPSSHVPYDPGTVFAAVIADDFTQMRTVALGPDGSSGTDLLSEIAVDFGGGASVPAYNNPLTFPELMNAYLEVLQEPLTINMVDDGGTGNYTPGAPDQLVFIGVWDDAASAQTITVEEDPSGTPTAHVGAFSNTQIGYAAVVIDNPTANETWAFDDSALANPAAPPDQRYVLTDLRVLARFLVAQKPYGAGDTISLGTRLLDTGVPLLNAEVTVEIAGPGEGLGNFLTTKQTCEPRDPVLPRPDPGGQDPIFIATPAAFASSAGGGDPIPGRHGLTAALFDECGLDGLDRLPLPGEQLHDDGAHGDAVADDGLYTLDFTDTATEGTYTFRFHARGVTADGVSYSRTRTASIFVGIEPDGGATDSVLIPGAVSGNVQNGAFYLLPIDGIGNYLGPGFAHRMPVSIDGGTLVGDLVDLGNAIYLQNVQFAPGSEPDVDVGLPGGDTHEFSSRTLELIAPKLGFTAFDSGLGFDDGLSLGAELAWRIRPQTYLGVEIANTFTEAAGSSGDFTEALVSLRRDFSSQEVGTWTPYIKGAIGAVLVRDLGADDEAFAVEGRALLRG